MTGSIVFAPHPDDEVIGCGGSLLHATRRGEPVHVVTLGARLSSPPEQHLSEQDYLQETLDAHAVLGVSSHAALQIEPRTLTLTRELTLILVTQLRACRARFVYMPHAGEVDLEHRTTAAAALEALWMAQSPYFPECGPPMPPPELVLGYEVWTPLSSFQLAVDISDTLEEKKKAMNCYRSQALHSDWASAIEGLARYRGVTTGAGAFAEVFQVISLRQRPA
jgi:N-acetylglucosamine malate deacetylase 1